MKVKIASDRHGYLSEEISRQSAEDIAWFLLAAYGKMKRREKSKELLSKKEPKCEHLENSQPIHFAKIEKACSGENTNDMTGLSLEEAIIGLYQ